jgi:hypothetical protein
MEKINYTFGYALISKSVYKELSKYFILNFSKLARKIVINVKHFHKKTNVSRLPTYRTPIYHYHQDNDFFFLFSKD